VYTSAGGEEVDAGDIEATHVEEANAKGVLDAGEFPNASTGFEYAHVVVEISIFLALTCGPWKKKG
jgi:hypothetical protein